ESFGITGLRHDIVIADRAKVSDPSDLNSLDAEFVTNVVVQTTDGLTVKTSYFHYKHAQNTVETTEADEFEGRNFAGRSTGALIETEEEKAHLLKDVEVTIKPKDDLPAPVPGQSSPPVAAAPQESQEDRAARKAKKRARRLERKKAEAALAEDGSGASPKK